MTHWCSKPGSVLDCVHAVAPDSAQLFFGAVCCVHELTSLPLDLERTRFLVPDRMRHASFLFVAAVLLTPAQV